MGPLLSPRAVHASCALWGPRCSSLPYPSFALLLAPSLRSARYLRSATFDVAAWLQRAIGRIPLRRVAPRLCCALSFTRQKRHVASFFAIIDGDRVEKFSPSPVASCAPPLNPTGRTDRRRDDLPSPPLPPRPCRNVSEDVSPLLSCPIRAPFTRTRIFNAPRRGIREKLSLTINRDFNLQINSVAAFTRPSRLLSGDTRHRAVSRDLFMLN